MTFAVNIAQGGANNTTMRNRIINGAMVIDQRNAGAAVTTSGSYPVDRFVVANTTDGAFSAQQDSSAPAGFVNSVKFTATTADATLTTTQSLTLQQRIEGTNIADLGWGTANAQPITLSFWVQSSLTGTFGGALRNSATDRSYPFTYSISVANTWEQKSVTIAGDTTGTWLTTNGIGIRVFFGLGAGPDISGTAGAWAATGYVTATGAVSVIGTLNATWYVTGVQLEKGSTATSFDYRPYGTELQLCQRYYEQFTATNTSYLANGFAYGAGDVRTVLRFLVPKRASPTPSFSGSANFANSSKSATITSFSFDGTSPTSTLMFNASQSGFTTGQALQLSATASLTATIAFPAEL